MEAKVECQPEFDEAEYLETLTPKELKAYYIAVQHLGSSFQLDKSLGFIKWQKK